MNVLTLTAGDTATVTKINARLTGKRITPVNDAAAAKVLNADLLTDCDTGQTWAAFRDLLSTLVIHAATVSGSVITKTRVLTAEEMNSWRGAMGTDANDYFADTGGSTPFHTATTPSAFHSDGVTWLFWEAYLQGTTTRCVQVRTYNHAAARWGPIYTAATNGLTDDDHGVPSACIDARGYVHVFYGSHATAQKLATSTFPNDPSQWTLKSNISGSFTYPHPTVVGSNLYLFLRSGTSPNPLKLVLFVGSIATDGAISWGPMLTIGDFGDDSRWYQGVHVQRGMDIHMVSTRANEADTERKHVYYLIYSTLTGAVRNFAGTVTVAAGSLPVTLTQLNDSFKVIDQPSTDGNVPALCFDTAGAAHVVYMDGTSRGRSIYHVSNSGAGWSAPMLVGAGPGNDNLHRYDGFCVTPSGGAVRVYWIGPSSPAYVRGGDVVMRERSAAGSWGAPQTIYSADATLALDNPSTIRDGHASMLVTYAEVTALVPVSSGVLKVRST